jgi:hypothetical protein
MRRPVASLLLIAVLVTVTLGGCFRHHIVVDDRPAQPGLPRADVDRFFVLGIVRIGGNLPLNGYCRTGVARIHQRGGFIHLLLTALTSGVITSRAAAYSCVSDSVGEQETGPRAPIAGTGTAPH